MRLALSLNYSVYMYDFVENTEDARFVAINAFNGALQDIEKLKKD